MIVKLIKKYSEEDQYEIEDLTLGNDYEILSIEADSYRIINETENEPFLYPADCFQVIDKSKPSIWVTKFGEDGEEYSYPSNWGNVGFFEDYFDGVSEVKEQFWSDYHKYYNNNNS